MPSRGRFSIAPKNSKTAAWLPAVIPMPIQPSRKPCYQGSEITSGSTTLRLPDYVRVVHPETIAAVGIRSCVDRSCPNPGVASAVSRVASKLGRRHQGWHGTRTEGIRIRVYQESVRASDGPLPCKCVLHGSNSVIGDVIGANTQL